MIADGASPGNLLLAGCRDARLGGANAIGEIALSKPPAARATLPGRADAMAAAGSLASIASIGNGAVESKVGGDLAAISLMRSARERYQPLGRPGCSPALHGAIQLHLARSA